MPRQVLLGLAFLSAVVFSYGLYLRFASLKPAQFSDDAAITTLRAQAIEQAKQNGSNSYMFKTDKIPAPVSGGN